MGMTAAAAGAAKAGGIATGGVNYALLYGGYRVGMLAYNYLFKKSKPKPRTSSYAVDDDDIRISPETPLPICYGTNLVNGQIVFRESVEATEVDMAVAFCEGEVDDITSIRFDNVYADYTGKITYTKYNGTSTQLPDTSLNSGRFRVVVDEDSFTVADEADSNTHQVTTNKSGVATFWYNLLHIDKESGGSEKERSYLKFDLSDLPEDLTFTDAKVKLQLQQVFSGGDTTFCGCTLTSFVDTEVTWNTQPATINTIVPVRANYQFPYIDNNWDGTDVEYEFNATGLTHLQKRYDQEQSPVFAILGVNTYGDTDLNFWAQENQYDKYKPTLHLTYTNAKPNAFRNTAYVACTVDTRENRLLNPQKPNVTAVVVGKKIRVWDADLEVWTNVYSRNPAWIIYDILTNQRAALNISSTLIDIASFKTIAAYCDEEVTNEDGSVEKRYECSIVLDSKSDINQHINDVLSTFMGYLYSADGTIHLGVDRDLSLDSDFALDTDSIIAGSFSYAQTQRHLIPNAVKVLYTDPDKEYRQMYVRVDDEMDISARGEVIEELPIYGVQSRTQAVRLAKHILWKGKYSRYTFKCRVSINQAHILSGELCSITHPVPAWTAKQFKITSIRELNNDEIEVEGEEYVSSLYGTSGVIENDGSNLSYYYDEICDIPNGWDLPAAESLTLTESFRTNDDGSFQPQIKVAWTIPDYVGGKNRLEWHIKWRSNAGAYTDQTRIHAYESPIYIDVPGADTYWVKIETFVYPDFYMPNTTIAPESSIAIVGLGLGTYPVTHGFVWSTNARAEWTTGKIVYQGEKYDINSGNTTNAYIWFDKDASTTVLQTSNTRPAFDADKWLMAYYDSSDDSVEIAESGKIIHAGLLKAFSIEADNIAANAITAVKIGAGQVTAAKLSVSTLSAIAAYAGTITSGTFKTANSGQRTILEGSDNTLRFHSAVSDNVVVVDDNIVGSRPGIKITDATNGVEVLLQKDANDYTVLTEGLVNIYTEAAGSTKGFMLYDSGVGESFYADVDGDGYFKKTLTVGASLSVSANITVGGLVDGVDVAGHASRHADGGADEIAITDLAADTNWRLVYANGAGAVANLALGATNSVLVSQNKSAIPTWSEGSPNDGDYLRYDSAEGGVYWSAT